MRAERCQDRKIKRYTTVTEDSYRVPAQRPFRTFSIAPGPPRRTLRYYVYSILRIDAF